MGKLKNKAKVGPKAKGQRRPLPPLPPPSKTIEQLAREQGVKPIMDFDELNKLGEGFPEGEFDAFIEFIQAERAKERARLRRKRR